MSRKSDVPAGHEVGVVLQDVVGVLTLQPVEHDGIAIKRIEVFQQGEAIRLSLVRIGLILGDGGGHLDRHLLVGNGGFQG